MSEHDQGELRVELRRFLGGVPFSHEREMMPEELAALRGEMVPFATLGVLFFLLSAFVLKTALGGGAVEPLLVLVSAVIAIIPGCCLHWIWPHIQALRSGKVAVYIGRMSDIAAFDVVQEHYRKKAGVDAHLNRYIEILAIGNGHRIWRLEGIPNNEALSGVRPIWLALVPDHDERGERSLTQEEARELRLRAADFRQKGIFCFQQLLLSVPCLILFSFVYALVGSLAAPIGLIFWLVASIGLWLPYLKRRKFALMLIRDAKAGVVRDGWLSSGMPWVVNGEPARWRVGRPRGGAHGVTKDQALALEGLAQAPTTGEGNSPVRVESNAG